MEDSGSEASTLSILIIDDEPNIRKTLGISLRAEGHQVVAVSNSKDALIEADRRHFDLALVDLRLGTESGMDLITKFRAACPWMKCVVITAYASIDSAVEAMRRGAFDYLPKPFTHDQVTLVVRKVAEVRALEQKVSALQDILSEAVPETVLESRSPVMRRTLAMARQVADSEATILIRGESGTGKTIIARGIHSWSHRASKPFGTVSCPSLSAELLESELFGHARGSFTGPCVIIRGALRPAKEALSFSMKSVTCPYSFRPSCCGCFRIKFMSGWVILKPGEPTCGFSRRQMWIWNPQ